MNRAPCLRSQDGQEFFKLLLNLLESKLQAAEEPVRPALSWCLCCQFWS